MNSRVPILVVLLVVAAGPRLYRMWTDLLTSRSYTQPTLWWTGAVALSLFTTLVGASVIYGIHHCLTFKSK